MAGKKLLASRYKRKKNQGNSQEKVEALKTLIDDPVYVERVLRHLATDIARMITRV